MTRVIQDGPPDRLEYGFTLQGELLHLGESKDPRKPYNLTNKEPYKPTLGEWTTRDLMVLLDVWLHPEVMGSNSKNPNLNQVTRDNLAASYGEPKAVVIYTWYNENGSVVKSYKTLALPEPLPLSEGDLESTTLDILGGRCIHTFSSASDKLQVGKLYYFLDTISDGVVEITVLDCLVRIGRVSCSDRREVNWKYLMLSLTDDEVVSKMMPCNH